MRLGSASSAATSATPRRPRGRGLAPCPLQSDTDGPRGVGHGVQHRGRRHRWTLTVTPQSDGTVDGRADRGRHRAALRGRRRARSSRPGRCGSRRAGRRGARARVQAARGWEFPDQATADRFLEHAVAQQRSMSAASRPPGTRSRAASEVAGGGRVAVGARGPRRARRPRRRRRGPGGRARRARSTARRRRHALRARRARRRRRSRPVRCRRSGPAREEWIAEYTFGRDGPRELAFRTARAERARASSSTETVARLDLRDPGEPRGRARRCSTPRLPWPPSGAASARVLASGSRPTARSSARSRRSTTTRAASSGSVSGGWKFGGGVQAHQGPQAARRGDRARRGGPSERERFDCAAQGRRWPATSQVQSSTRWPSGSLT